MVNKLTLMLVVLVVPFVVLAQGFTDINASLPGLHYSDVAWGDYDADGDLDIIIAGQDETSNGLTRIYRNDGNDTFVELTALSLPGTSIGDVTWGDYDGDNDLDFLLQGYAGSVSYTGLFINEGSDNFTDSGIIFPGLADGSVSFVDFNNDGFLDIFMDGFDGSDLQAILYENDGLGGFFETTVSFPTTMKSCYEWADYDNDNDLDVFITGYTGTGLISQLYCNNGDGTFSLTANSFEGAWLGDAAWGDYNSDGYVDILVSGHAESAKIAFVYKNNGDGSFSEVTTAGLTGVSHCSTIWGDYDNDGDLDVFIGGTFEDGVWVRVTDVFINNGDDTFTEAGLTFTNDCYWGESAWGDYDADGDLDLVCSGYDDLGGQHTRIYRNEGTPNTVPTNPENLLHTVTGDQIDISWDQATDAETASSGLYYNAYIRSSSGDYVWSPMADLSTGTRTLSNLGNVNQNTNWTINNLIPGDYFWSVQALDNNFAGSAFASEKSFTIVGQGIEEGSSFIELRNYPDPFTVSTSITVNLGTSNHASLSIYSIDGRIVKTITDNVLPEGIHQFVWNGTDNTNSPLGAGVYFIKLTVPGQDIVVERCTLLR